MSKAPVMAGVLAGIGCRQGLEVGGDVESLGRRVTAAVVHAIFANILVDALFALIYMKLYVCASGGKTAWNWTLRRSSAAAWCPKSEPISLRRIVA